MTSYLQGLRNGEKYHFGSTILSDYGMDLKHQKFFSSERIFCRWSELSIYNGPGTFCVQRNGGKEVSTSFSYLDQDDINILETTIRSLFKRGGDRISSLLGE
jgi:hypothetical protein